MSGLDSDNLQLELVGEPSVVVGSLIRDALSGMEEDETSAARSEAGEDPPIEVIRAYAELELAEDIERAAGKDVKPGHDELHHYWVAGPGLARWAGSPKPWTTLVSLLTPHVGVRKAKVFASRWFIEHFGFAAGSDRNRVLHGHPPRGKVVGPG